MEGGGAIGKINQREGGEDLSTLYRLVQKKCLMFIVSLPLITLITLITLQYILDIFSFAPAEIRSQHRKFSGDLERLLSKSDAAAADASIQTLKAENSEMAKLLKNATSEAAKACVHSKRTETKWKAERSQMAKLLKNATSETAKAWEHGKRTETKWKAEMAQTLKKHTSEAAESAAKSKAAIEEFCKTFQGKTLLTGVDSIVEDAIRFRNEFRDGYNNCFPQKRVKISKIRVILVIEYWI